MKIRNGFVSNSSSSSFVIVTNKESLKSIVDELNLQLKGIKHPTIKFAESILKRIVNLADEKKSADEYIDGFGYRDLEEYLEDNSNSFIKDFDFSNNRLYVLNVCSDSGEADEMYLYENSDSIMGFKSDKLEINYQ